MDDPVKIVSIIIIVLATGYALFTWGPLILGLIWELIRLGWTERKEVKDWPWEKKFAWILVIVNTIYSYFNKESPALVFFFSLVWILLIYVVIDSYFTNLKWDTQQEKKDREIIHKKTLFQKQRIKFIILVIIFSTELLTQHYYNHSIVNVIKVIMSGNPNQYEDY